MFHHKAKLFDITEIKPLKRRDFLKLSSVSAGLLASGFLSVAPSISMAQVPDGINHLNAEEYKIWHRLMRTLLPTKGTKLVDPETLPVLQTVDGAFLATMPPAVLEQVKGGIAFFNKAPTTAFGKPFVDLSDDEAVQFCDALAESDEVPARSLFTALKFLTVTAYWAIPPTWEPVGFQGPVSEAWGLQAAGNSPLPEA